MSNRNNMERGLELADRDDEHLQELKSREMLITLEILAECLPVYGATAEGVFGGPRHRPRVLPSG